jgi:hypothetical protein
MLRPCHPTLFLSQLNPAYTVTISLTRSPSPCNLRIFAQVSFVTLSFNLIEVYNVITGATTMCNLYIYLVELAASGRATAQAVSRLCRVPRFAAAHHRVPGSHRGILCSIPLSGIQKFMVEGAALRRVFSVYFGFPSQFSFH